ncbi:MAG TPA: MBL fold metallo-hydrolase [Clostridia bacterium]
MKLYVLGCMGPYPEKDAALSGYLVESKSAKVLLDCGNGVLARLQNYTDIIKLDAVILTHLHADHMSDILVLRYYCAFNNLKLDVYLPQEDSLEYSLISSCENFNIINIEPDKTYKIKDLNIHFVEMAHPKKCFGVRLEDEKAVLAYTGDTTLNPNLDKLTLGADTVLMDCAFPTQAHKPQTPHMSLSQGALYAQNKPFKLLVTHIIPNTDITNELKELGLNRVYQDDIYEIIRQGYNLINRAGE